MATSCEYYIKKTNNPRICKKNASSIFMEQGLHFDLTMCTHHSWLVLRELVNTIGNPKNRIPRKGRGFDFQSIFSQWDDYQIAQMCSLLQFRIEEYNRLSDEIQFIGEMSQNDLLERGFEEAKNDGRYIDLTESFEQKIDEYCPICLEEKYISNTTFLRCGHPICNNCLKIFNTKRMAKKCPVCRTQF